MPEMDGLEMLRRIRREYPQLRVIMFSTLTERGAAITLEALTLGADDYVTKASNEGSLDRSMARLREELLPKIKQFFQFAESSCPKRRQPARRQRNRARDAGLARRQFESAAQRWSRSESPREDRPRWARSCRNCRPSFLCRCWWCSTCRRCSRGCWRSGFNATCQLPVAEASQGERDRWRARS